MLFLVPNKDRQAELFPKILSTRFAELSPDNVPAGLPVFGFAYASNEHLTQLRTRDEGIDLAVMVFLVKFGKQSVYPTIFVLHRDLLLLFGAELTVLLRTEECLAAQGAVQPGEGCLGFLVIVVG